MKVVKKLNNNLVLAYNDQNEEIIIRGKGLGFEKIPYFIPEKHPRIENIYIAPKNMKIMQIVNQIPSEISELTKELVAEGERLLKKELNAMIYVTLSDHLMYAVERCEEELEVKNPLHWEIKNIYPKEYQVSIRCLDMIEKIKGIRLPDTEASFITLHFVNAQVSESDLEETSKLTKIIGEIVNIVKYYYQIDFDEDSMTYNRFVTHIRYFVIRQMKNIDLDNSYEEIFNMVKKQYVNELDCVSKIATHLKKNYGWNCSDEEMLYLVLHIQRLKSNR